MFRVEFVTERTIKMKNIRRIVSLAAALSICAGMNAGVSAFSDMPQGEVGTALQHAVDAGLMNGVTEDSIAPDQNITRAQMATIITRAFGATDAPDELLMKASASIAFNDVAADAWYAKTVAKAVKMGAFQGDAENNFNPEKNITCQEAYIVLSRVFGFEGYERTSSKGEKDIAGDCDVAVLDAFADKGEIDSWAVDGAKYIVGHGGWTGFDGKLLPKKALTRGEFALIMDKLVATYIDEPGEYKALPAGLTMVRSGGVTIDGLNTDKNLVITYAVDEKGCKVQNSTVTGVTLILGGADKANKGTDVGKLNSYVSLEGQFDDIRIEAPYIAAGIAGVKAKRIKGASYTRFDMGIINGNG